MSWNSVLHLSQLLLITQKRQVIKTVVKLLTFNNLSGRNKCSTPPPKKKSRRHLGISTYNKTSSIMSLILRISCSCFVHSCLLPSIAKNSDVVYQRIYNLMLTFQSLAVSLRTTRFNIKKFYIVLAWLWVFCTDLRANSEFCFIHH